MFKKIIYIILGVIVFSCETVEEVYDIDLLNGENKKQLTGIYSSLSPNNKFINVVIEKTAPLYTNQVINNSLRVKNANVYIVHEQDSIRLNFIPENDRYLVDEHLTELKADSYYLESRVFPIIKGEKYRISAFIDGKYIYGETTVPLNTITIKNYSVNVYNDDGATIYNTKMNLVKPSNFTGYLSLFAFTGYSFNNSNYIGFDYGELDNGSKLDLKVEDFNDVDSVVYSLHTSDVHFYKYHKDAMSFGGSSGEQNNKNIYSNVHNGVGYVGSYTSDKKVYYPNTSGTESKYYNQYFAIKNKQNIRVKLLKGDQAIIEILENGQLDIIDGTFYLLEENGEMKATIEYTVNQISININDCSYQQTKNVNGQVLELKTDDLVKSNSLNTCF
ncbi:DUF4249 family protein [Flammeovirga kamogawensis]|uniref:DUF4249 domain-containing protein n=1 Tax=Flammeovirga kamogawensis TaxID=373891 RepID=A0ABX8GZ38_9BACT|nr:DUF4249 family protein [Flammeovirga kamogawensis]MBB6458966.1 hypothetical protein [Flammeovirga kamogawensis]QWG08541.1 DUF4249 domain-containing protein [Flammeovirga kamogawensis]TRX66832.1 DUF4249 family protein [Flammeovirga kamogawensis]